VPRLPKLELTPKQQKEADRLLKAMIEDRKRQRQTTKLKPDSVPNQPVGYLVPNGEDLAIVCPACQFGEFYSKTWIPLSDVQTPIYRVNIYPYKAVCIKCKTVLVEPQSNSWPELYDSRPKVRIVQMSEIAKHPTRSLAAKDYIDKKES
jgi:hypothetical protein